VNDVAQNVIKSKYFGTFPPGTTKPFTFMDHVPFLIVQKRIHRLPEGELNALLLVAKILSIEVGEAVGLKCVTLTDDILHDHFPDLPILPGALITEGLAQLAGFLLEATFNRDETLAPKRAVLVQIDKMKFHSPTGPGDTLTLRARLESFFEDAAQAAWLRRRRSKTSARQARLR
jgi:3-hydroxymyristoyl/3-hydroxydecanoyl-(acyl carrier protein) dehydratase